MPQVQTFITARRVEAYAASALRMLGWLLGAILRLNSAGRSVRLKHLLSRAEFAVECILFLKAVAPFPLQPQRRRYPRSPPPGFRRVARNRAAFIRSVGIRARKAGALTRVLALIGALTHPARAVAYFRKKIGKGMRLFGFVAVEPPADALVHSTLRVECGFRDSS